LPTFDQATKVFQSEACKTITLLWRISGEIILDHGHDSPLLDFEQNWCDRIDTPRFASRKDARS
jgi:hypothetical protein